MSQDPVKEFNQNFNVKWLYTAWCFPCQKRFIGTKDELNISISTGCNSADGAHRISGGIVLCSLPGRSVCRSCGKWYQIVKGGENTEDQCDECSRNRKPLGNRKLATPRKLHCDGFFTMGKQTAHRRATFLIVGEDWACCVTNDTSNYFMGESSQKCLRRGKVHVEDLERHSNFPGAAHEEYCGIMCQTHAKRLQKQWAVKVTQL